MFEPFPIGMLLLPSAAIMAATLIFSYAVTRNAILSTTAGALKAGLFLLYFGVLFDGTYTALDDWSYLRNGIYLLNQNVGFLNIIENWQVARGAAHGDAFLYYLYNAYAFWLFGHNQYFAPVALNLILVAVIAYLSYRLVIAEFASGEIAGKLFFFFVLFHPDILAWSIVFNLKDIVVLLLHILLLIAIAQYMHGKFWIALLVAIPTIIVFTTIRQYVPIMFAMALILAALIDNPANRAKILVVSAAMLGGILLWKGLGTLTFAIYLIEKTFVNPIYGLVRFTLTPIPFNSDPIYSFLDTSAVIHWLLTPFFLLGIYVVWKQASRFGRFVVLYMAVFLCVYAMVGELQGPRHRVQLDFAFALFQFMGLLTAYRWIRKRWDGRPERIEGNLLP